MSAALDSGELDNAGRYSMLMMRAALRAESPRTAQQALEDYAAALAIPGLRPEFRHNAWVNRASLHLLMENDLAAIADLSAVLDDDAALSEHMRFSAHYQRGLADLRLKRFDEAVHDYSSVVDDSRAPDATRQSARLRRGVAHLEAGALSDAKRDDEAVLADPRSAGSTLLAARNGLQEVERLSTVPGR